MTYYSRSCGFVQVSPDGATWYDISGVISNVEPDETAFKTADGYTSAGNLLIGGKAEPTTIQLTGVYSNNALEGYNIILQTVECGGRLFIRWGATILSGNLFLAENCRLLGLQKPGLNARDPLAMMWGFKVLAARIKTERIPVWPTRTWAATVNLGVYTTGSAISPNTAAQPIWESDNTGLPDMALATNTLTYFGANQLDTRQQYCVVRDGSVSPARETVYTRTWPGVWAESLTEEIVGTETGTGVTMYLKGICYDVLGGAIYAVYARQSPQGTFHPFKSANNGASWTYLGGVAATYTYQTSPAARGNEVLVIGRFLVGGARMTYRLSSDGGATWAARVDNPTSGGATTIFPFFTQAGLVYANVNTTSATADLLRIDLGTSAFTTLLTGQYLGPSNADALWMNPADVNHGRILKANKLWITNDAWATLENTNPAEITPAFVRMFTPQSEPDVIFFSRDSATSGTPHILYAMEKENGTAVAKSGDNPDGTPFTDSIPYTCGGLCTGGLVTI